MGSYVWPYFTKIGIGGATCNFCYEYYSLQADNSNIKYHMNKKHEGIYNIIIRSSVKRRDRASSIQCLKVPAHQFVNSQYLHVRFVWMRVFTVTVWS